MSGFDSWLNTGVGSWLNAGVGLWLNTGVGLWLNAGVGLWLNTGVSLWLNAGVGNTGVSSWLKIALIVQCKTTNSSTHHVCIQCEFSSPFICVGVSVDVLAWLKLCLKQLALHTR